MTDNLVLDPKRTALVLIDLQRGIMGRQTAPHSASDVMARSNQLAKRFREAGAPVVLVNVSFSPTGEDRLSQPIDAPAMPPMEKGWDELSPDLSRDARDILVTKRQWGAFYGTALDLQLRRRKIDTIVIAGIATNFGVESTARDGYERGYAFVFAEDAMASSPGAHEFAITTIFPRLGRVRSSDEIMRALKAEPAR